MHSELSEIMSHVYLFSHVGLYVFLYLFLKELSSNNLRFFQNNLGLVFHTTYSCIFHSCYLLLHFPLLHFSLLLSAPAFSTPAFSTRAIYSCYFHSRIFHPCNFDRIAFSTPAFSVAPAKHRITQTTPCDSSGNLAFWCQ